MSQLIVAHAASFSDPREPLPTDRYLLAALSPNARVHCQRRRGSDSARVESESPIVMEIGRRQPNAPRGRLISTLLHMAHSVLEGPMTRRFTKSSPRLLRRELMKAFTRLVRNNAHQPDVSMAVMHRDRFAVASNGGGALLRLGLGKFEEVAGTKAANFDLDADLDADLGADGIAPRSETLDPGDRLVLVSPSLADCLEARDFEGRRMESASPRRLTTYLLDLARIRDCRNASVIASAQAEGVEPGARSARISVSSSVAMPMGLNSRPAAVAC